MKTDRRNKKGTLFQDRLNLLLDRAQNAADWLIEADAGSHPEKLGKELQEAINKIER